MALTISGHWGSTVGLAGPFKASNGRVYVFGSNAANAAQVRPSYYDPINVGEWFNTTTALGFTAGKTIRAVAGYQRGDIAHLVVMSWSAASSADVDYVQYNMATESWGTPEVVVSAEDVRNSSGTGIACVAIGVRSNGSVVVAYNSLRFAGGITGARVRGKIRSTGGVWGAAFAVDDAVNTYNYQEPAIGVASNDRVFVACRRATGANPILLARAIESATDALSATVNLHGFSDAPFSIVEMASGDDMIVAHYNFDSAVAGRVVFSNSAPPVINLTNANPPLSGGSASRYPSQLYAHTLAGGFNRVFWAYVNAANDVVLCKSEDFGASFTVAQSYVGNVGTVLNPPSSMAMGAKPYVRGGAGSGNVVVPILVYDTTLAAHVYEEFIIHHGFAATALTRSGAATLGAPALGVRRNLTATSFTRSGPVSLGTPSMGYTLTATSYARPLGKVQFSAANLAQRHALTATGKTAGSPTLGSPTLGHKYGLTAEEVMPGWPQLGTPALVVKRNLTATNLTRSGAVTFGTPVLGVRRNLTATNFTRSGAVTLGTPVLGVRRNLTASSLTRSGAATLGTPALGVKRNLTATSLTRSGAAVIASPALKQRHALAGLSPTRTSPVLGQPGLGQRHILAASALTNHAPQLGTPGVGAAGSYYGINLVTGPPQFTSVVLHQWHVLVGSALNTGPPSLPQPTLVIRYFANAASLTNHAPTLGAPTLTQRHALTAQALTSSAPSLGTPALVRRVMTSALPTTSSAPQLGTPSLAQRHALQASALTNHGPSFTTPVLGKVIFATSLTTAAPQLGTPTLKQRHVLATANFVNSSPQLGSPIAAQALNPLGFVSSAPEVGEPELHQGHNLTALNVVNHAPTFGSPVMVLALPLAGWAIASEIYESAIATYFVTAFAVPMMGNPEQCVVVEQSANAHAHASHSATASCKLSMEVIVP